MRDEKQVWTMKWTQPYESWPEPQAEQQQDTEMDLTLAREVLARIMAK